MTKQGNGQAGYLRAAASDTELNPGVCEKLDNEHQWADASLRKATGGVLDEFGYDAESNLMTHSVDLLNGGGIYVADSSAYDYRGKMVFAHTHSLIGDADILMSYSGLGAVTATEQQGTVGGFDSEEFIVDALGNRAERRQNSDTFDAGDPDRHRTLSYNERGQLTRVDGPPFESPYYFLYTETYQYDGAGNTTLFHKVTNAGSGGGTLSSNDVSGTSTSGTSSSLRFISNPDATEILTNPDRHDAHMSYYGGDGKLRVFSRHIGVSDRSQDQTYGERGTFDEYRYDALGRRVLTRTRRIGVGCPSTLDCQSRVTRTVWDGDQVLSEIRAPGGEIVDTLPTPPDSSEESLSAPRFLFMSEAAERNSFSAMQVDTTTDPLVESDAEFVSYSYAPGVLGVDEPIEIHKGSETVIPYTGRSNRAWRGSALRIVYYSHILRQWQTYPPSFRAWKVLSGMPAIPPKTCSVTESPRQKRRKFSSIRRSSSSTTLSIPA